MKKLRAAIVDDERNAIKTLEWELRNHCPNLEVVASWNNPVEALQSIPDTAPDILFLDIDMPRLNGFDLLNKLEVIDFEVIFITAYDEYAVKAFRINAVDYLLKPIITSDLIEAIKRVQAKRQLEEKTPKYRSTQFEQLKKSFNKIALTNSDGIDFVFPYQIIYCKSDGSYTYVIMENKKAIITKSLRDMEEQLLPYDFLRVHKSYLVNLTHINKYMRIDGGYLIMSNNDKVPVSRRKKEELLKLF